MTDAQHAARALGVDESHLRSFVEFHPSPSVDRVAVAFSDDGEVDRETERVLRRWLDTERGDRR